MLILLPGPIKIGAKAFDFHFMFVAALLTLLGFQVLLTGFYAKAYAFTHRFAPDDRMIQLFYRYFSLEKWILVGLGIFALGLGIDVFIFAKWINHGFKNLFEVRPAILALTLMVIGGQLVFSSFLLSILNINTEQTG
jgi:hypothetical protein